MEYSDITYKQIEEMQHAIGFNKNKVTGIKHRVMRAYRNHFCDHIDNQSWEILRLKGLADRGKADKDGICYFHVTENGLQFLATLCGFEKIVEIE